MKSVWSDSKSEAKIQSLNGDISTDILIIGAGMAGILCGYFLRQKGADCVIVDGGKAAGGVTGNTTAKVTAQHGLIYNKLSSTFGIEKAEMYLKANLNALEKFWELGKKTDCDMMAADSYVYSKDRRKLENEMKSLMHIGYSGILKDEIPLPVKVSGAVGFKEQAQFNPIKFINGIRDRLTIYEDTFVKELDGRRAITDKGIIKAAKIIIATHFPFINRHGMYFMKMHQHRSYVIAIKTGEKMNAMYVDEADKGMSFRGYGDMLFIGGGGHKTGEDGGGWRELRDFAASHYPGYEERYHWATQDCMTLDKVPYIGEYGKNTAGLYVATGFNKWGMTSSMVSAMVLSDLAVGKDNPYADLFRPDRSMLRPQLFANIGSTLKNFVTLRTPRCTHLGCVLKWNEQERSWDCPCHGSRYNAEGNVIENPATKELGKTNKKPIQRG